MDGRLPTMSLSMELQVLKFNINLKWNNYIIFINYSGHFIDNDWVLRSITLDIFYLPHPHSGVNIAKKMDEVFLDYGIKNKVFSYTSDSGSNYLKAGKILTESPLEQLNLTSVKFQNRCSAHLIQRIIISVLDLNENCEIQNIISKIR